MSDRSDEKIAVEIFDRKYTFASEAEETTEQIRVEAERRRPPLSTAVLAGLTLADELLKLRAEYDAAKESISSRTSLLPVENLPSRYGDGPLGSRIDSLDGVESREE